MEPREKSLFNQQLNELSERKSGRRRQLQQMLTTLQDRQIQGMRALRDRDGAETGDEADTAVSEDNFELSTSLVDMAAARRAAVEDALQRVEHGSYGVCEECGDEIPVARLLAIPTAVLCVDCQQVREASSKQLRRDGPFLWVSPTVRNRLPLKLTSPWRAKATAPPAPAACGVEGRPEPRLRPP